MLLPGTPPTQQSCSNRTAVAQAVVSVPTSSLQTAKRVASQRVLSKTEHPESCKPTWRPGASLAAFFRNLPTTVTLLCSGMTVDPTTSPNIDNELTAAEITGRDRFTWDIAKVTLKQVRDGSISFVVERVNHPKDVYEAVLPYYREADREILSVLCLDSQNQPASFSVASVGGLNTTRTRPADILKCALLSNSLGLILIHNHPSGCLEPSPEDIEFTRAVGRGCEAVGLELYDHLVVTDDGFTSLRERGLL